MSNEKEDTKQKQLIFFEKSYAYTSITPNVTLWSQNK
jgi:hypothetical protein